MFNNRYISVLFSFQSASSLQGYGFFRAGVLQGSESTVTSDPKTSTAQRKPNRWTDTPDKQPKPDVPPKPQRSRNADDVYNPGSDRSASPKPLTSNPPSSCDVRKPLPKTPAPNPSPPNGSQFHVPNYENQSEMDRYQHHQITATSSSMASPQPFSSIEVSPQSGSNPPYRSPELPPKDKKSQQFSLKAWLKKEKEQVRKGVESDVESTPEPKPQSSRSFSKFKNSMIQKFSSGSTSKKQESPDKRVKESKQTTSPPRRNNFDTPPYDVLLNNYQQRAPVDHYKPDSLLTTSDQPAYPSVESEQIISPIDDPDVDDIITPADNKYQLQNGAPPQMLAKIGDSDLNNNDKYSAHGKFNSPSIWQDKGEDILHGRVLSNQRTDRTDIKVATTSPEYVGSGAESKCVVAHAAPIYKARVINNYENQGKFENPNIIRQQAEPAKSMAENGLSNSYGGSNDTYTDARSPYSRLPAEHTRAKSSDDVLRERQHQGHHSSSHRHNGSESSPYGQHASRSSRSPEKHVPNQETPRKRAVLDNRNYLTPGNRVPMNVHSIGSLIDRFDKYNNNSNLNDDVKPETMTSTPVAPRKAPVMNGDVTEASPPLPPRSPSKSTRSGSTPNDSSNESRKSSSRYTSPDRQSFYTPQQSRMDSHLNNSHISPPSVYSTPQGGNITHSVSNHHQPHQFTPQSSTNSRTSSYLQQPAMNGDAFNDYNDSRLIENGYRGHVMNNGTAHNNINHAPHSNSQIKQSDDRDEGYRAKLRRAANSQSAFDRYSKGTPQYTGRPNFGSQYETNGHSYGTPSSVQSPLHNNDEVSYMAI